MSRLRIQVVAAVTAAVGFALSVIYNSSTGAATALRAYAYSTSIAIFLFLIYDRYVWHWPIVRRVTKKPDLRGTWKGELKSSYLRDGKPLSPIPSILRIRQTNSTHQVTLFTGESASVTEQSQMVKEPDDRWRLTWTYSNTPRASVRDRSDCHLGTAEVTFDPGEGLVGSYYTDRLTRGELAFPVRSRKLYTSVDGAQRDTASFGAPEK
jgi:hypothetical protein